MASKKGLAASLLLLGTAFWGLTFVIIKDALTGIAVFDFLFWRFLLAGVFLALFFPGRVLGLNRVTIRYGVLQGLMLAASYLTQTIGLQWTSATRAAFITGLAVVMVPFLLPLCGKDWPGRKGWLSTGLALGGLVLLTFDGMSGFGTGDVWILACAVFFALYIVLIGKYGPSCDPTGAALIQILVTMTFSAAGAITAGGPALPASGRIWGAILFCSLLATTYMYVVQNRLQRYLSEITTAVIFSLEPLFAALAAWLLLAESFSPRILTGGAVMIAAMLLAETGSIQKAGQRSSMTL